MNNIISVNNAISKDVLRIEYCLGNTCNYSCWYCFPNSNTGTYRWPDIDIVKKNLSHLIKQYLIYGKKRIEFKLIGGEPTLWPKLGEFAEYFSKEFNCLISMSTNGSRTLRWWRENAKYFGYIDLSVHHAEADINHLISVADCVYDQNVYIAANVLMDFNAWDKCISIIDQLKKSKRRWYIAATDIQHNQQWHYTEEQQKFLLKPIQRYANPWYFFKTHKVDKINCSITYENKKTKKVSPLFIVLNNLNHFQGWECNAGIDRIHITMAGDILACNMQQPLFNKPITYNIYQNGFTTVFNPKITSSICVKKDCNCTAEILLKKRKLT